MTYLGELISIGVAFSWTATAGQPWGGQPWGQAPGACWIFTMPRTARDQSATGIYHVMIRGINRQDIFETQ